MCRTREKQWVGTWNQLLPYGDVEGVRLYKEFQGSAFAVKTGLERSLETGIIQLDSYLKGRSQARVSQQRPHAFYPSTLTLRTNLR